VLFGVFLVSALNAGVSLVLLLALGRRVRFASRLAGVVLAGAGVFGAGVLAAYIWHLPAGPVEGSQAYVFAVTALVVLVRPVWNPVGQYFFGAFVAAALAYLGFAADVTVAGGLSVVGSLASAVLFLLEFAALSIAASFAFETCDVICRVRHSRAFPAPDPAYRPMVSVHIPTYNEPPDMIIQTIRAAEALRYPALEIVVVDNNTSDEATWRPVEEYCASRPRVTFVHVDPWPGYKSGALNLALSTHTDPRAEIVGIVDSDYLVSPEWLEETVGYFADPNVAFIQTPQDYREFRGNRYLTACYDAYRYFFASSMPSRNERNSIIFAGTMGLLRRSAVDELGGWDEWCITEDAETSLRLLKHGYSGLYLARSYGRGIMPLTFSSLKSQRFRWCFGGMQILRLHWRTLLPWARSPENRLSVAQRVDYLLGSLQWMNDLVYLAFTIVLFIVAALLLSGSTVAIRPLIGPTTLLPGALLAIGLLRAIWALRERTGISYRRAALAFANWLSLSWTVALACIEGLLRRGGVFLRTPKTDEGHRLLAAMAAARVEIVLSIVLWGLGGALAATTGATPLLVALMAWQGAVYATAPYMSWLDQREQLPPDLELRRRSERRRERVVAIARPVSITAAGAGLLAGLAFVLLLAFGASNAGTPGNPFNVPRSSPSNPGPLGVTGTVHPTQRAGHKHHTGATTTTTPSSTTTTTTPSATTSTTTSPTTTTTTTTTPTTTTTTTTAPPAGATGATPPGG
jgi:cellulose synthase/poly-beta-1,6-N-acetylglucosamine synthase-like glycosyltransferase